MFTFDDFLQIPEQSLRELMGQVDKRALAVALKGASEELRTCIFRTMSSRAVDMLKEEIEVLGPVPKRKSPRPNRRSSAWPASWSPRENWY